MIKFEYWDALQVGNDFLPSIPSLDIYDRRGGLDLLMRAYKKMHTADKGYLINQGVVNPSRLSKILEAIALDEEDAYERKEVRYYTAV